jgi:hypothetical protein
MLGYVLFSALQPDEEQEDYDTDEGEEDDCALTFGFVASAEIRVIKIGTKRNPPTDRKVPPYTFLE